MLKLFRSKPPENPAEETKVDSIRFPFFSRVKLFLWPFAGKNFFEGIVTLAAKMASSDGAINETELKLFTRLLDVHFSLSEKQKIQARRYLFRAQTSGQTFSECLNLFYRRFKRDRVLLENAFDVLLSMAYSDNIVSIIEQELLVESASVFQFDQRTLDRLTARHHNWKTHFERAKPEKPKPDPSKSEQKQKESDKSQRQRTSQSNQQQSRQHFSDFVKAFEETWNDVLGVPKDATRAQVKKAYRDLVRAYHPDALPSNLPPEMMRSSVERFIQIQKAYETYVRTSK